MNEEREKQPRSSADTPPRLLAITPENAVREPEIGDSWLRAFSEGREQSSLTARQVVVQVRDKVATDQQLRAGLLRLRSVPGTEHFRWVINQRPHLLEELSLDGVHWPGSVAGEQCQTGLLQGISCHSLDDVAKAAHRKPTYVVFGPVFDTPQKRIYGAPQGLARLTKACALGHRLGIPVLAIGGMDSTTAGLALQSGAAGVAAIRALGTREQARMLCQNMADSLRQQPAF